MLGCRAVTVILEMRLSFLGSLPPRQAFSSWDCKCYNGLVKAKQLWSWARAAKPRFRVIADTEVAASMGMWKKVQQCRSQWVFGVSVVQSFFSHVAARAQQTTPTSSCFKWKALALKGKLWVLGVRQGILRAPLRLPWSCPCPHPTNYSV